MVSGARRNVVLSPRRLLVASKLTIKTSFHLRILNDHYLPPDLKLTAAPARHQLA